jgi:hypothetical protein
MYSGRIERNLLVPTVVALLCVLTIFFFPAMQGPYSVVHGPVTALLSARAADGLRMTIVQAGLKPVRSSLGYARLAQTLSCSLLFATAFGCAISGADSDTSEAGGNMLILRC